MFYSHTHIFRTRYFKNNRKIFFLKLTRPNAYGLSKSATVEKEKSELWDSFHQKFLCLIADVQATTVTSESQKIILKAKIAVLFFANFY